ncbi:hypothetical protein OSB04_000231 [Centaurea solstitialis]|uniref:Uncharacterized protein n=1 Tax=Centaurea solstitialis TaxID=347529 RepID=A0AA38U0E6_9ASTR|nr:hypothetical protein OSB04_000231 [Centaurea solstitialis]
MDTLFRLVSLQKQPSHHHHPHHHPHHHSLTNSTNSNSSKSSNHHTTTPSFHFNYQQQQEEEDQEECFNFFMDDEDFSSSSSRHHHHQHNQYNYQPFHHQSSNTPTPTTSTTATPPPPPLSSSHYGSGHDHGFVSSDPNIDYSYSPARDVTMEFSNSFTGNTWAGDVLVEAARATAEKNTARLQHLMWMLNELSSPYGDVDQKLSSYFLQALFSRMTDSGHRSYQTLQSASDKMCSFESTRKLVLKFQEVSPWTTFGHVASNAAIMEAFDGEPKLHIIDVGNTYCTQWPTLLEAIATKTDDTPHLRLTTVISAGAAAQKVMREIGNRMEKFARLMGVPFNFSVIHHTGDLSELDFNELGVREDEALAVNLNGTLRAVGAHRRDYLLSTFRGLNPKIVTIVEEEADLDIGNDGFEFVRGFQECLRWFRVYFEALDQSFPKTSNERLMLERAAGRGVMDLIACPAAESVERRETAARWSGRLHGSGFSAVGYSDEVCDDVRALLRRYREGWSMSPPETAAGMFLTWKETPVVWASAWKPI